MIFVYLTCKNRKEAQKIGQILIKEELAACVNFWPIESIYKWQGKIVQDKEIALIVKTLERNFDKIEKRVKELHSYQTPCIVALPVNKINQKYFNWLKGELK